MNVINRLTRAIARDGFRYFLVRMFMRLLRIEVPDAIKDAKLKALSLVKEKYGNRVAFGPFAGMLLNDSVWWSREDQITQTLGVYESHIVDQLCELSNRGFKKFIDVGAADGYFCNGCAYAGLFDLVVAFEISESGRASIKKNAIINKCDDRITIRGKASAESLIDEVNGVASAVILIDIEGDEFSLLTEALLEKLSKHSLICELHPWKIINGQDYEADLIKMANKYFNVKIIKREIYNPNAFEIFDNLNDEERLIAFGESRKYNQKWLILEPLNS